MNDEPHVLCLVSDDSNQVFLHADARGLDLLIKSLQRLRKKIDQDDCDHDHLMTESWGDGALTEPIGCEPDGQLVHHLKIYGWTDEWAKKNGFTR